MEIFGYRSNRNVIEILWFETIFILWLANGAADFIFAVGWQTNIRNMAFPRLDLKHLINLIYIWVFTNITMLNFYLIIDVFDTRWGSCCSGGKFLWIKIKRYFNQTLWFNTFLYYNRLTLLLIWRSICNFRFGTSFVFFATGFATCLFGWKVSFESSIIEKLDSIARTSIHSLLPLFVLSVTLK